jgi:hypothetical protein
MRHVHPVFGLIAFIVLILLICALAYSVDACIWFHQHGINKCF